MEKSNAGWLIFYLTVAIDHGDSTSIHPQNKISLANRIANQTLKNNYNLKLGEMSSPMVENIAFEENKAIVTFKNIGSGIIIHDKYGYPKGFEVEGADKHFHRAKATLSGNKIIVICDTVSQPVAIRYGWYGNTSDCNVFNADGLPAAPFRSDKGEMVSENEKYLNWIK